MFKEPSALAKSWVSAQKMMGAEKVVIPNDKSTEEDWNVFFNKIGRPESADKYEIKPPEGMQLDEAVTKPFKELAHKLGLSAKQVAGLSDWNFGAVKAAAEAKQSAQINELRDSLDTYAKNLGGEEKFKARVDTAKAAMRVLAKPELQEYLKKSGAGSHPAMIEHFAELAGMMDEGKIRDGTGIKLQGEDPAVIQASLDALQEKMFSNLNSPDRLNWAEQAVRLRERLAAARQQPA
jgi:hypothetical protein